MSETDRPAECRATERARELREEGLTLVPLGAPSETPPAWFLGRCADRAEAMDRWPKTPRVKWGAYQQTPPSDTQFETWCRQFPRCNWAILTGRLVVIDADDEDAMQFLESGAVTRSPRKVVTAKGAHYYYLENPSVPIRNRADSASKIDFRGHGGYVVAPESVHASGAIYTEETLPGWGDTTLTELPQLTADDIAAINSYSGAVPQPDGSTLFHGRGNLHFDATAVHQPARAEPVAPGGRNVAAASLAGQFIQAGDDLQTARAKLQAWNDANPVPLGQGELDTTLASVATTHVRNHGEAVPLSPTAPPREVAAAQMLSPLPRSPVSDWADRPLSPRAWLWENWIPMRQSTGLYAAGGTGKTLFAQQLATAVAAGRSLMGQSVRQGGVVGLFCEDDTDELHRRQRSINESLQCDFSALGGFHALSRVGHDNTLMTFKSGKGTLTPFWHQVDELVGDVAPALVIVDTAADTFAGNENVRPEVRQYVQQALTQLAVKHDCAVLLCAHPSRAGIMSGTGESGSTAWENSLRSRLYMEESEFGGMRTLSRKKANYAQRDDSIEFFWHLGCFVPTAEADLAEQVDAVAQNAFIGLVRRITEQQKQTVSTSKNSPNYAPRVASDLAKSLKNVRDYGVVGFRKAMDQLIENGALIVVSDERKGVTSRLKIVEKSKDV